MNKQELAEAVIQATRELMEFPRRLSLEEISSEEYPRIYMRIEREIRKTLADYDAALDAGPALCRACRDYREHITCLSRALDIMRVALARIGRDGEPRADAAIVEAMGILGGER